MSLADALAKAKGGLKQSETRVTLRDGRQFIEKRDDSGQQTVEFVGKGEAPEYLREEEKGFSTLKPAYYSAAGACWSRSACSSSEVLAADQKWQESNVENLRVVTFNVWFADQDFDVRAELLFDILKKISPDIICLQEVTPRLIQLLTSQVWLQENYWMSDCTGVTVSPYGVLMLSRLPVSHLALYLIPTEMGRRALIADLLLRVASREVSLRVATVHLESMEGKTHRAYREAQLQTLFPLFADCQHTLLMGDFNFDPSKPEQEKLDRSFIDVWCAVHKDLAGHTFRDYPVRIDRMMAKSNTLSPTSMTLIGEKANSNGVYPSDHLGLYAEFSVLSVSPS